MTNNPSRRLFPLLLQFLAVLVIAATFMALGLWQWDRAERHQELTLELDRIATMAPVGVNTILSPVEPLDGAIANRLVTVEGRYLRFFTAINQTAKNQSAGNQDGATYQVGLLEVSGSAPRAAILVARQLNSSVETPGPEARIEILARILPTQREDRDPNSNSEDRLRRIDSALIVESIADPTLALYDGFLLLREERVDSIVSSLALIPDQIAEPTIPGYYWQHISYVVIWFLMAGLVLYLPFYQRRRNRLLGSEILVLSDDEEGVKR